MRLLTLALAVLLCVAASAQAAPTRLTVRTSLGPIADDGTRNLRAHGSAPRGSTLVVRFYRGSRRIGTARPTLRAGRYLAREAIKRAGDYRVRVTATTRGGKRLRASATLDYGPTAEAPSAPD